jgi:hypothetical protein
VTAKFAESDVDQAWRFVATLEDDRIAIVEERTLFGVSRN